MCVEFKNSLLITFGMIRLFCDAVVKLVEKNVVKLIFGFLSRTVLCYKCIRILKVHTLSN